MTQPLEYITISPSQPATSSVIWLHGLGADGNDFVPIVPQLHLPATMGIRFIFPHAPVRSVTIAGGYAMKAWYDVIAIDRRSQEDRSGILASVGQVHELIKQELELGIPSSKIILAGFSQGGAMALQAGLRYELPLAGILGLSTYLPLMDTFAGEMHSANRQTPVFLAHGNCDDVVSLALGEMAKEVLVKQKVKVDWHVYPGLAHGVCPQEVRDIGLWITQHVQKIK